MPHRAITDEIWEKLLTIMTEKGCYNAKNGREVMEAILWKLRTGAQWREVPMETRSILKSLWVRSTIISKIGEAERVLLRIKAMIQMKSETRFGQWEYFQLFLDGLVA